MGCPLFTVEASFDGTFHLPADWRIDATTEQWIWQKEALLNFAVERLPPEFDQVAWIDADFLFLNPDWAAQTSALLEHVPVVQMFETVHDLDARGCVERSGTSLVHDHRRGKPGGRPGGAWAARRDLVDRHKLYAHEIVGGGDCRWSDAVLGITDGYITKRATPAMNAHAFRWAKRLWKEVQGAVGCVPGDLVHLYHGTRENRRYAARTQILLDNEFDPLRDVVIAPNGMLQWGSDKPKLRDQVRDYFEGRDEDSPG